MSRSLLLAGGGFEDAAERGFFFFLRGMPRLVMGVATVATYRYTVQCSIYVSSEEEDKDEGSILFFIFSVFSRGQC